VAEELGKPRGARRRGSAAAAASRASDGDAALIRAYLQGDPRALEEVELWVRTELRRCYSRLQDEFDDIAQSVHEKLLASLQEGRFRGGSALRTYLISIVHHTAIDRLRELYQQRALSDALAVPPGASCPGPAGRVEELEDVQLLHQLLQLLPSRCRELWRLVFVEKASYQEVAERLGIPAGTVKSRMWHCRGKAMALLLRLRRRRPRRPR
jgi:RNA polymerase sigma-70 factor (ECF subfamily)